ncbi:MAG: FAD:protein transferase [Actinomycetota bacterium]|nr:FAD:protein transferase [Actinomycetota bacterium]
MTGIRPAPLQGWQRQVHTEHVWTTVVTIDVRGPDLPAARVTPLLRACAEFTHDVDRWLSPFRPDSAVSAINRGDLAERDAPAEVVAVLDGCRRARELTGGAFDPWHSGTGRVDPSGYVKGWAADCMAQMVTSAGFANVCVNAGGDITCRGEQAPGMPWAIGLQHPARPDEVVKVVHLRDAAVATSGRYERGDHIVDPALTAPRRMLDSATVVGPDGGLADALATALVVTGAYGVGFLPDTQAWSAYLVTAGRAQLTGPAFT